MPWKEKGQADLQSQHNSSFGDMVNMGIFFLFPSGSGSMLGFPTLRVIIKDASKK